MKVIGENEVRIQLKESTGPMGPAGPQGPKGEKGATGPAGANGKDYVLTEADKQEIAGMVEVPGGVGAAIDDTTPSATTTYSSQKIEDELSALNDANAAQDTEIAKKANAADLAAVAKSGSYTDLTNKPTIPTVPSALPNPNKLKLTGAVTAEYDGSAEVNVEIPAGGSGSYTLPIASPTTLGGVMPAAKTDEMTQAVGVDESGGLWALPGGGNDVGNELFTVECTEEVSVISASVSVSKKLFLHLHVPTLETSGTLIIKSNNIDINSTTGNKPSTANESNYFYSAEKISDNGLWRILYSAYKDKTTPTGINSFSYPKSIGENVSNVSVSMWKANFPAGTRVTIWGV